MSKKVGGKLNMNKKKIIGICVVIFVIVFIAVCIAIVQFSKKDLESVFSITSPLSKNKTIFDIFFAKDNS